MDQELILQVVLLAQLEILLLLVHLKVILEVMVSLQLLMEDLLVVAVELEQLEQSDLHLIAEQMVEQVV